MLISIAIPAFNATTTISRTLESVYHGELPDDWRVETIIVDDGSTDSVDLEKQVSGYNGSQLVRHSANRGMCAARNTGIDYSKGDVVIILDSDDELVSEWPQVLQAIIGDWPEECNLCFAACRNQDGNITATNPGFQGYHYLDDLLGERNSGEYLPIFRGDYIRKNRYVDLELRKSCGILSYIKFALDGPFWISRRVLRIYHQSRPGSVTQGWTAPDKAAETARCYEVLMERYGSLYRQRAPAIYRTKQLRLSVYLRLARMRGVWSAYKNGASLMVPWETIGVAVILLIGPRMAGKLVTYMKDVGIIRRYG